MFTFRKGNLVLLLFFVGFHSIFNFRYDNEHALMFDIVCTISKGIDTDTMCLSYSDEWLTNFEISISTKRCFTFWIPESSDLHMLWMITYTIDKLTWFFNADANIVDSREQWESRILNQND